MRARSLSGSPAYELSGASSLMQSRSWSSPSLSPKCRQSTPNAVKQAAHDATATVTRVVDGDTIEISRSVEALLTERLIGVDTPETHGRSPTVRRPATSLVKTSKGKRYC